jgi:hypothetical protein
MKNRVTRIWRWNRDVERPSAEKCRDDEELLRALHEADPAGDERSRDWATSEAGRQVYERILARTEQRSVAQSRNRRTSRLVLLAGAAAVVVAAVVLGLVFGLHGPADVVSTETTAAGVQAAADRVEVLERVVRLAEAIVPGTEFPDSTTANAASSAARAQALGIIVGSERTWAASPGSLTRATYALWMWRAFGDRLRPVKDVSFSDLGSLSEEVRQAVLGVAGAGILGGEASGLFKPDDVLSQQAEQDSFRRLEQAIGASIE